MTATQQINDARIAQIIDAAGIPATSREAMQIIHASRGNPTLAAQLADKLRPQGSPSRRWRDLLKRLRR